MNAVTSSSRTATRAARYFQPRRLGHVNLWVDDIHKSERFYNETCGLNVEFTEPDLIATFLGTGHTPHDLGMMQTTKGVSRYGRNGLLQLPGTIGLTPGLNHLAWELENEQVLVQAWRALKAADFPIDMTVDHQVAHSVYVFDPDGNYNEFYCDTVKDWRNVLTGEMELITSQWDPETGTPFTEGRYDTAPVLRHNASAPVHPQRITHAVLTTPRLDAMLDFYTRIGGLRVVSQSPEVIYLAAALDDYPYSLVLVKAAQAGFHHASFELADEAALVDSLARLRKLNSQVWRDIDLPWKRAFMLKDGDGLLSEWYVARDGAREMALRGDVPLACAV